MADVKSLQNSQKHGADGADPRRESEAAGDIATTNDDAGGRSEAKTPSPGQRQGRRISEAAAEAIRQGGERSAESLKRAGAATSQTIRYGSEAIADGHRQLAAETAQRLQEIGHQLAATVQGSSEDLRIWLTFPSDARGSMQDLQQGV
jgi:hypothetical protein